MLDTGADTVYIAKELANEIGLSDTKERAFVKGVNARSLPIDGGASGAQIQIGGWKGKVNITVPPLDEVLFGHQISWHGKAFFMP